MTEEKDDGMCRSCVGNKCVTGSECVTLGRDASPPRAIPAEQVVEALKNYRCTHFVDEEGGLPLADALAAAFGDKDVGRAMEEIDLIADAVYSEPRRTTT